MRTSSDRILTSHAGSLPRPQSLSAMLFARTTAQTYDEKAFPAELRKAVAWIVKQQSDLGVDVVSDGEMSKISYATYIARRLAGFDGDTESDFLRRRHCMHPVPWRRRSG